MVEPTTWFITFEYMLTVHRFSINDYNVKQCDFSPPDDVTQLVKLFRSQIFLLFLY